MNDYAALLAQLGPSAEDKAAARQQAIMRAGMGILAASGPSRLPQGLGGILAQGGMQGMDTYNTDLKRLTDERRTQALMAKGLADEQRKRAEEERKQADGALLARALQGRPAQPAGLFEDAAGVHQSDALPGQTPVQSLGQAIPMMGNGMQPVALNALLGAQTREDNQAFRTSQSEEARRERQERQTSDQAFRDQQARQAALDREALVRANAASRPPPQPRLPMAVLGPDGKTPVYVPADQAVGRQPWSPTLSGRDRPMTATAQKELIETEEGIQGGQAALTLFKQARALNEKAMGFTGAGSLASAGSILPSFLRPEAVDATQNLDNILQTAALPQLKAIFGGMPTEGERKILLDVQGSSSKPPKVRKEIFDRAEKAIQARIKFGAEKVKRLRDGTYFSGEGLPSIQQPGGNGGPPAGIDPALWAIMTTEEKAAFAQ